MNIKLSRNGNRIFWGVVFIAAAVLLVIGKLGYLGGFNVFTVVATVLLAAIMVKGILRAGFGTVFFSAALLAILYAKPLHIETLVPWTVLLVALFATIGFHILFHNTDWRKRLHENHEFSDMHNEIIDEPDGEVIHQKIVFGGATKYVNSDNLKEIDIDCSFSAIEIFMDKAHVPSGHVTVHMHAAFGGITLFVPKEWSVENHLDLVLGGLDFKNRNEPDGSVMLTLSGDMALGGVEVTFL